MWFPFIQSRKPEKYDCHFNLTLYSILRQVYFKQNSYGSIFSLINFSEIVYLLQALKYISLIFSIISLVAYINTVKVLILLIITRKNKTRVCYSLILAYYLYHELNDSITWSWTQCFYTEFRPTSSKASLTGKTDLISGKH